MPPNIEENSDEKLEKTLKTAKLLTFLNPPLHLSTCIFVLFVTLTPNFAFLENIMRPCSLSSESS